MPKTYCRIMTDEELDRLAAEELLLEAGRGKQRASTMGTYGWKKRQVSTNKVFLKNTLRGVMSGNRQQSSSRVEKRHKDSFERRDRNVHHDNRLKNQKFSREPDRHGHHHHRLAGTAEESDTMIPGGSSRSDDRDFHSRESCSQRHSRSSSAREGNQKYKKLSYENELDSSGKGKDSRRTSGKHSSTKEKR